MNLKSSRLTFQLRGIQRNDFMRRRQKLVPVILTRHTPDNLAENLAVVRIRHHYHAVALVSTDKHLGAKAFVGATVSEVKRIAVLLDEEAQTNILQYRRSHLLD